MFGTRSSSQLTAWVASCESCRKKLYGDTDRASLGRDPRDDGFGALMCQKCVQSQIRLGEWGGGGGRRTENQDHIYIYIYGGTCKSELPLHSAFLKDMRELHSSFCSLKASMRSNGGKAFSEALRGCDLKTML